MPAYSRLINVARGGCVDEQALIARRSRPDRSRAPVSTRWRRNRSPETSPLWTMENVVITPHTGGETERYEDNLFDILLDNIDRLWRGEFPLRNQRT